MRGDPLAQEIAAAQLEHAARQFVAVSAQVVTGDSTQAQLRARRTDLQAVALTFALAHGWTPPAYAQACPATGAE